MTKKLFSLLLLGLMSFSLFAETPANFSEDMTDFQNALDAKERVIVDFSAHWWGSCAALVKDVWNSEEFQALAKEKNIKLFYADIDVVDEKIIEKYKVESIPTWILIEKETGKEEVHNGKASLEEVLEKVNKFFVD